MQRKDATMKGINYMAAIGRIMMAAIFLVSGFLHALHLSSPADVRAPIAVVTTPEWAFYVATGIELVGGVFLALGLGTRYVALILAIFMLAMSIGSNFGQFDHFLKNLAIAGGLIQVWAFGSGGLAITHSRPRAV
jgi:putative oxidoreductase